MYTGPEEGHTIDAFYNGNKNVRFLALEFYSSRTALGEFCSL